MIPKIKVVGYVRLSQEDNDAETSITNQKEMIDKHCKDKELLKIYDEGKTISGGDMFRPAFLQMIDTGKKGNFKEIIVKDSARFGRGEIYIAILKDLEAYGVKVFSIMENRYLNSEDLGDKIKMMIDGHYIIEGRKKYRLLLQSKKDKGLTPTPPPFGYKWENKQWVIDEPKAKIVRRVFENKEQGVGYRVTCNVLNISIKQYYAILKNKRIYEGYCVFMQKVKDSNNKVIRKERVEYEGIHKKIII